MSVAKPGTFARRATVYALQLKGMTLKRPAARRPLSVHVVTPFGRLEVATAHAANRAAQAALRHPDRAAPAARRIRAPSGADQVYDEVARADARARRTRRQAWEQERAERAREDAAVEAAVKRRTHDGVRQVTGTMRAAAEEALRREGKG
jgi:hypothetical protein